MMINDDAIEKAINEHFSAPTIGSKLIQYKLNKNGVNLSNSQIQQIQTKLQHISGDSVDINIDVNDEQKAILGLNDGDVLDLDIGEQKDIDDAIEMFLIDAVGTITSELYPQYRNSIPGIIRVNKVKKTNFNVQLQHDWKKPFELFEAYLHLSFTEGSKFNYEFRRNEKTNYVIEALIRLHSRACQITCEILVLLENGLADGAYARWRTLHEISVVACFITTYGDDIAERYLLHNLIENYFDAISFNEFSESLGYDCLPKNKTDSIKTEYDQLIDRFGKDYGQDYGWAAPVLNKNHPTFKDIEKQCGLGHLRPYYKLACHNVHADSKGLFYRLGLDGATNEVLLAGPSKFGIQEPALNAIMSLEIINIELLSNKLTINNLIRMQLLIELRKEIEEEFINIEREISEK